MAEFKRRREVIVKRLNAMGLRCVNPEGAFYAFVHAPRDSDDDLAFTERLLTEAHIVVTPGSAFGSAGRATCGSRSRPPGRISWKRWIG